MMEKLQNEYPERRDELLNLLGVDLQWRMHQVRVMYYGRTTDHPY